MEVRGWVGERQANLRGAANKPVRAEPPQLTAEDMEHMGEESGTSSPHRCGDHTPGALLTLNNGLDQGGVLAVLVARIGLHERQCEGRGARIGIKGWCRGPGPLPARVGSHLVEAGVFGIGGVIHAAKAL